VDELDCGKTDLGAGEREVLALGIQVPGAVMILDERLGRLHAEALKLRWHDRFETPSNSMDRCGDFFNLDRLLAAESSFENGVDWLGQLLPNPG
jgi:hypothetical protein